MTGAIGILAGAALSFEDTVRLVGVFLSAVAIVLFLLTIQVERRWRKNRKEDLSRMAATIETSCDINVVLSQLASSMGLRSPWRFGLYEVRDGEWHRLLRRSNFEPYENSVGRPSFPSSEGCLGEALRVMDADELPSLPDPRFDRAGYEMVQLSRRLPLPAIERLAMPSRSYAAVVFELPYGAYAQRRVGVVVESTEENGVQLFSLRRHFTLEVVTMVHALAMLGPMTADLVERVQADEEPQ